MVKSTKRTNRKDAEALVKAVFTEKAKRKREGYVHPGKSVTLGQVFAAYFTHEAPSLTTRWRRTSETRRELFEAAWGHEKAVRTA